MVFGVFDNLHPGHHSLFVQAKKKSSFLIAVIARDQSVKLLKNKEPQQGQAERLKQVLRHSLIDKAVLGDKKLGVYGVLKKHKPHIIFFGYDQQELYQDIKRKILAGMLPKMRLVRLKPFKADKYHSSILSRRATKKPRNPRLI
jgi:cytidyltransferase-like protein